MADKEIEFTEQQIAFALQQAECGTTVATRKTTGRKTARTARRTARKTTRATR